MRIAIAGFSDETCTFCTEPTPVERFEPATLRGKAILDANRGIPTYINGYMRVLESEGAEIVPLVYAGKTPGRFQSWLTTECFDKYADEIAERLAGAGKLDGVLLSLHGAMAATGVPKPEAEVVRRARKAVGSSVPIMVTLDLHANEDHELTDAADAVFVLKTYPHVDSEEIGEIAARCMVMTARGEFRPVQSCVKPGIISASIYQASAQPPMKIIYDRCREWEGKGVYCASVAPGYAYADVPDVGMTVITVTNGDQALADRAAQDISDLAWSLKEQFARKLPKPKEGVAEVMKLVASGQKPVVIADGADRIGDSTHVLAQLLAQGAKNWAIPGIADAPAAKKLEQNHKVGDKVTIKIGGWYSELSGQPVEVTGVIEYMGRPSYVLVGPMRKGARVQDSFVARLNLGDNRHVVVSEVMRGSNDSSGLTALGVDISTLDIIVLKDRVHHRAFWDSVAKVDYPMDAPGIGLADLSLLTYHNIPDDVYPRGKKWQAKC